MRRPATLDIRKIMNTWTSCDRIARRKVGTSGPDGGCTPSGPLYFLIRRRKSWIISVVDLPYSRHAITISLPIAEFPNTGHASPPSPAAFHSQIMRSQTGARPAISLAIFKARSAAAGFTTPRSTIASAVTMTSIWQPIQTSSYAIAMITDARSPAPAAPELKVL